MPDSSMNATPVESANRIPSSLRLEYYGNQQVFEAGLIARLPADGH